jgi:hypothetical protein
MKRTILKSKTPLRSKTPLKSKGVKLKKSPINKVSKKQSAELKLRSKLKAKLIAEFGEHCMTCHDVNRDFRGLSLSHVVPLSRGGLTVKSNCVVECYPDHEYFEKQPEKRKQIYPYHIDISSITVI